MIFHNEFVADVLTGDCIESMRTLPDKTVNCCVTSPPYFGLRDYGMDAQLGLESSPDAYVAAMVEVFREVKRVLRDDGTLWLNIGDSYAAQRGGTQMPAETLAGGISGQGAADSFRGRQNISAKTESGQESVASRNNPIAHRNCKAFGIKHKDLIGIPWMLAFALRADGWYLRQDIIWHKPNPMPESVKDRCTKAHEYMFLLSKSEKYYFDSEAMQEQAVGGSKGAAASFKRENSKRGVADVCPASSMPTHRADREDVRYDGETRNRRSVWSVATRPYKGAHFATFPPDLIEPCVLAGCPPNGIVLDPFGGSGTTGGVALRNGRHAILCELNPEYVAIMPERVGALCK